LASAYVPSQTITAGQANVVTLTIHRTNLTPDNPGSPETQDITFAQNNGSGDVVYIGRPTTGSNKDIATVEVDPAFANDSGNNNNAIEVKLASTKLQDLINASVNSGNSQDENDVFSANKVTLSPRYQNAGHSFDWVSVSAGNHSQGAYPYSILTNTGGLGFGKPNIEDEVDGVLLLELEYYAFSDPLSGSTLWNIRNGIYATNEDIDDNGYGGAIVVQFGNGSKFNENVELILLGL
jgi:hypothetical protein